MKATLATAFSILLGSALALPADLAPPELAPPAELEPPNLLKVAPRQLKTPSILPKVEAPTELEHLPKVASRQLDRLPKVAPPTELKPPSLPKVVPRQLENLPGVAPPTELEPPTRLPKVGRRQLTPPALPSELPEVVPRQAASGANCPANSTYPSGTISPFRLTKIAKSEPDRVFGEVPVGIVTPGDICTIVNLKIPDTVDGLPTIAKTCTLSFSLPTTAQAAPRTVLFNGPGHFSFYGYMTGFGSDSTTTWNKQPVPGPSPPFPPNEIVPGKTYVIADLPCGILPATKGQTVAGRLCSEDTSVQWEQTTADGNGGCPIGFFVVVH